MPGEITDERACVHAGAQSALPAYLSPEATPSGLGWRRVPLAATPEMLAAVAPQTQPSPDDYDVARTALALLPFNGHPDVLNGVAQLASDYRAMVGAAPPEASE